MSDLSPRQMEGTQKYLRFSLCYSHFNEKARWAMSYYRVQYTHQLLLPFFHMFTIKPIVDSGVSKHESRDKLSSPFSTPCLALYDASGKELEESFHDSHDILVHLSETFSNPEHVNLYKSCGPENEEKIYSMEKHYDEVVGAAVIDFAYNEILVENKWNAMLPFATIGFRNRVGVLQSLFWFGLSPFLGRMIMSFRGITPDKYEKAMETLRNEFRQASELLEKSQYLAGDSFSAADLTLAALSCIVLGITHEEGYQLHPFSAQAWSPRCRAFQQELRATRAGKHVLRLFKEERYFGSPLPKKEKVFAWFVVITSNVFRDNRTAYVRKGNLIAIIGIISKLYKYYRRRSAWLQGYPQQTYSHTLT